MVSTRLDISKDFKVWINANKLSHLATSTCAELVVFVVLGFVYCIFPLTLEAIGLCELRKDVNS
jgi:hypothetical protein